jgi:hypothetical protein
MELENSLSCSHDTCRILILHIFKNMQLLLKLYLNRMRHVYVATARNLYKPFRLSPITDRTRIHFRGD